MKKNRHTYVEKGKTHFVVFLEEDENCTARIYDNFGLVLFDNCYTFDLYPGCIINPDNYQFLDRVEYNDKGWERVKDLREKIESGKIPQSDYE